jgi:hypothetical protein
MVHVSTWRCRREAILCYCEIWYGLNCGIFAVSLDLGSFSDSSILLLCWVGKRVFCLDSCLTGYSAGTIAFVEFF